MKLPKLEGVVQRPAPVIASAYPLGFCMWLQHEFDRLVAELNHVPAPVVHHQPLAAIAQLPGCTNCGRVPRHGRGLCRICYGRCARAAALSKRLSKTQGE